MSTYAKLSASLVAAWLVFSLLSSALHLYLNAPNTPPIAFGIAVATPILTFLLWFAFSPGFRQFTLSLSPRTLTLVQSMRIAGFVFLVLGTYKILPAFFALSAGWGDIAIGVSAPFAALRLANFSVTEASSGREGLALASRRPSGLGRGAAKKS